MLRESRRPGQHRGHCSGSCPFDRLAELVGQEANRRCKLPFVDGHDRIDLVAHDAQRQGADFSDGNAVGQGLVRGQPNRSARSNGPAEGGKTGGFHGDQSWPLSVRDSGQSDDGASEESTAATGHHQSLEMRPLGKELTYQRSLPFDHAGMVEGRQKEVSLRPRPSTRQVVGLVEVGIADAEHRAVLRDPPAFDVGGRVRHEYSGFETQDACREGDALAEVTCGRCDDGSMAAVPWICERRESPSDFERAGDLTMFGFEPAAQAGGAVECGRRQHGCDVEPRRDPRRGRYQTLGSRRIPGSMMELLISKK